MKQIINFYRSTTGVWKITRWLFIPMFLFSLLNISKESSFFENVLNGSTLIFVFLLIMILFQKNRNGTKLKLHFGTGFLAIMYAVIMSALLIKLEVQLENITTTYYQLLPIWVFLFGLWEILNATGKINRK